MLGFLVAATSWPDVVIALIVSLNGLGIAWVGTRQHQVKRELEKVNGATNEKLDKIAEHVGVPEQE